MRAEPCMECAKKHLRAALAYASMRSSQPLRPEFADCYWSIDSTMALTSAAWVLLGEAGAYPDHYDLAIGMLVAAEDNEAANGTEIGGLIRGLRLAHADRVALMQNLEAAGFVDPMVGHLYEARREGNIDVPAMVNRKAVFDNFDRLIKETETSAPGKRKEGEEAMACAKKACGKGGKCAAKGGKTAPIAKKAACKGGKAKKCGK